MHPVLHYGSGIVLSIGKKQAQDALAILTAVAENACIVNDICPRHGGKDVLISDIEANA